MSGSAEREGGSTTSGQDGSGGGDGQLVAGLMAAATALITGVGALTLTGSLGRVQRNHGSWFGTAILLVVMGAGISLAASRALGRRHARTVQATAALMAIVGVALGFAVAIKAAHEVERPSLTVKLDERTLALTGAAKVGDLASPQRLVVFVDGLIAQGGSYHTVRRLYQSYVGPDSDGNASNEIDLQVPPGRFDAVGVKAFTGSQASRCDRQAPAPDATPTGKLQSEKHDTKSDPGCIVLALPARPHRPSLTADWKASGQSTGSVQVTVDASDVGVGVAKDQLIAVQVVGVRAGGAGPVALYRAFIEPEERGEAKQRLQVPLDARLRTVCAEARFVAPGTRMPRAACPLGKSEPPPVAAAQLRIPRPSQRSDPPGD